MFGSTSNNTTIKIGVVTVTNSTYTVPGGCYGIITGFAGSPQVTSAGSGAIPNANGNYVAAGDVITCATKGDQMRIILFQNSP